MGFMRKVNMNRLILFAMPAMLILAQSTICYCALTETASLDHLIAAGDSLQAAWQLDEALAIYQNALARAQADDYKPYVADLRLRIGQIRFNWSQYDSALANWQEALTLSRQMGDKQVEANALCNLGTVYLYRGYFLRAQGTLEQSLAICRKIGDGRGEARALCRIGAAEEKQAYYARALDHEQQGLQIYQDLGDRWGEAEALLTLGAVYYELRDYETAVDYFKRAAELSGHCGNRANGIFANIALGRCCGNGTYEDSNFRLAFVALKQALDDARMIRNRFAEAMALHSIGSVAYQLAWEMSEIRGGYGPDSLSQFKAGLSIAIDTLTVDHGEFQLSQGYFAPALRLFRELGCRYDEAFALYNIGFSYFQERLCEGVSDAQKRKLLDQVVENYQASMKMAKELGAERLVLDLYWRLGWLHDQESHFHEAFEYHSKAIEYLETIRGRIRDENHKTNLAARYSWAYRWITADLIRFGKESESFDFSESGRARSFLDVLAAGNVKVGKSRHAEFLQKEAEFQQLKVELEKQMALAVDDTAQVALYRGQLEQAWGSIQALIEQQKLYEPELASMVTVNSLSLPDVQALLDTQTTLVEYQIDGDLIITWLVTRDSLRTNMRIIKDLAMELKVRDFRDAILTGSDFEHRSRQLYAILIAPIEKDLRTTKVVIVPYEFLHYLPFQALQDTSGKFLLDKYSISYLPSASALKYILPKKRPIGRKLLALGNPTTLRPQYHSLPYARAEINSIIGNFPDHQALSGAEASEDNFKRLAPQYDMLHLACHSELNASYPLYSGLILAPGQEQDGELFVHELFTMDLQASLVVLSACQTALGHITWGDELIGLSRGFIYAGTPSVLSSLWVVQDEATAYLMAQFYKNLKIHDKAESLRRAQLETMKKYPSPYFWASFVLIGDPG